MEKIKCLIEDTDVDVLCLTETWLKDNIDSNFIQIDGYELFRKDRHGKRRGGVGIYIKTEYTTRLLNDKICTGDEIDAFWINVQVRKNKSFIVGSIYRPPNASNQSFELNPPYKRIQTNKSAANMKAPLRMAINNTSLPSKSLLIFFASSLLISANSAADM